MDLNKSSLLLPDNNQHSGKEYFGDIVLRLNCFGHEATGLAKFGSYQNNIGFKNPSATDDGCRLVLGLGPTPSAYCNSYGSSGINKKISAASPWEFSSDSDSSLQLGLSGGSKEVSVLDSSLSTEMDANAGLPHQLPNNHELFHIGDEGSTSAKKSGGYLPSLLLAPRMETYDQSLQTQKLLEIGVIPQCHQPQTSNEQSVTTEISWSTVSEQGVTGASSVQRNGSTRRCTYPGCPKGARGASGLCIGHGGGQRCQKPGCTKGAESRTAYCKGHGGGRRCEHLGCTKSAEGKTDYCIAHGGGRRCQFAGGCSKAARGKSGLCIKHGGGKRCKMEGCTRSAEGQVGLCISHGGGRRCQYPGCTKGAQGSTKLCKGHGGGKRCIFSGCTKGAEGSTPLCKAHGGGRRCMFDGGGICPKSVHGGTNFCVAHGGGKRCVIPGCTKSARGRTDCCVRHGGGKRCKVENCGKSAQGSTDFCKAHGGGKRCIWGEGKCEKFARGKSGLCAAHSTLVQKEESKRAGLIAPGLFRGIVAASPTAGRNSENNTSNSRLCMFSDTQKSPEKSAKRQQLIPPQVLVPLSMKSLSCHSGLVTAEKQEEQRNKHGISIVLGRNEGNQSLSFEVPEGRVHGGGLMSLLNGNLG